MPVCHVNTDMWTSLANDPFASFVVTWLDDNWRLRTAVLRCSVVRGRHTANVIAAFLLGAAQEFGVKGKVGVVRTDGASNCVGAGRELGRAAGRFEALAATPVGPSTNGGRRAHPNAEVSPRGERGHAGVPSRGEGLDIGGVSHVPGGGGPGNSRSTPRQGILDGTAGPLSPDMDDTDDEEGGGDGEGLADVGSDVDDDHGVNVITSRDTADEVDDAACALASARADTFCLEMPGALHTFHPVNPSFTDAAYLWQHARCTTHTLQLSVRAGMAVPLVRATLDKVRLVAKLCRTSTNIQGEMRLAVTQEEARASTLERRKRKTPASLVSRLIIDCRTRWGSALAMLRRFFRVGAAVPAALSAYYHYTAISASKARVACPSFQEQAALTQLVGIMTVLESASATLGSEDAATSPMEEMVYWYVRRAGALDPGDCQALQDFKRTVLADTCCRRDRECQRGPNPDWFGIRIAAVLMDQFTKNFTFGDDGRTAAAARGRALDVISWTVGRAADAVSSGAEPPGDRAVEPPVKKRRTFALSLRAFASVGSFGEEGAGASRSASAAPIIPIASEWDAYCAFSVSTDSEDSAFSWWHRHQQLFPRVALGARYLLSIPATSVSSERLFCKAGRTISKSRARLTGPHAEQYIVLNDAAARAARESEGWTVS